MQGKKPLLVLVVAFAALYYAGRIGIFYLAITGEMAFEEEQSDVVENIVAASFLAIGAAGLLFLPGVWLEKPWGFWGTIAVSSYTIAFDVWALLFVQSSASAGIIPAAVILIFLLLTRNDYSPRK